MIKLFVVTVAAACFLVWTWWLDYLQFVFAHDVSRISYLITAVFIVALIATFMGKTSHLERVEIWVVTLGLIGNVVGFIIALQHIDMGSLGTAEGVQKVAANLLAGMGTAFCSTLVGAVAALWTSINAWVLSK